jgi:hypothetical protein
VLLRLEITEEVRFHRNSRGTAFSWKLYGQNHLTALITATISAGSLLVRNRLRASSREVTRIVSLGHSDSKAHIDGAMTSHRSLEDCGNQQGFRSVMDRLSSCRTPDMCFNQLRSHVSPAPHNFAVHLRVRYRRCQQLYWQRNRIQQIQQTWLRARRNWPCIAVQWRNNWNFDCTYSTRL